MDADDWQAVQHFTAQEFACKCGECGSTGNEMDFEFMAGLNRIRELCEFPFIVTSGYRCPTYNSLVSSTGPTGPHTTGQAADIAVSGEKAHRLVMMIGYNMTGIGIKQSGDFDKRFIHLDNLAAPAHPRPRIWSY